MSKKSFLIQLQQDLLEDRENEKCQADPIYYGILDTDESICPEGYEDHTYIYDEDGCESMSVREYYESLTDSAKEELSLEYDSGVVEDEDGVYLEDECEFAEYIENHNTIGVSDHKYLRVCYTQDVDQVAKDLLFLTRKDAEKYLEKYGYNHRKGARTFAMTAQRSPRYKRLLDLIKSIDWEKSRLVYRVSK